MGETVLNSDPHVCAEIVNNHWVISWAPHLFFSLFHLWGKKPHNTFYFESGWLKNDDFYFCLFLGNGISSSFMPVWFHLLCIWMRFSLSTSLVGSYNPSMTWLLWSTMINTSVFLWCDAFTSSFIMKQLNCIIFSMEFPYWCPQWLH